FNADWVHALSNAVPLSGNGLLEFQNASNQWGTVKAGRLGAHLETPVSRPIRSDPSWAWWAEIEPYLLSWEAQLSGFASPRLGVDTLECGGNWDAPSLTITNLIAGLYEGRLSAAAELDIAARSLRAQVRSDVNVHQCSALLTEGARHWLEQFSWTKAPDVEAAIAVVLPTWTNHAAWSARSSEWREKVQPTLVLNGGFRAEQGGAFRDIPVETAYSHFTYSNMIWRLPDLVALRP